MFSAFNPSKCTHTHLEQWAADTAAPGEQLGVRCLAQGSHLSRGQFLLELRFEPTTSGYKSNALSTRPPLPRETADAEITRFSVCVVNKTIHTEMQNMQDSYLKTLLLLNIYRYQSISRFDSEKDSAFSASCKS